MKKTACQILLKNRTFSDFVEEVNLNKEKQNTHIRYSTK